MSDDNRKRAPMPTYSDNMMTDNIAFTMNEDDIDDETTRRAAFHPNVGSYGGPVLREQYRSAKLFEHAGPGPVINTQPSKLVPGTKPTKSALVIEQKASQYSWRLPEAPELPPLHPLERSAAFVPHTSAAIVAVRVSDILRDLSIEASYDNAKARVKCLTGDNVDFRIRLYRGRNQYSHGIIVEVQRRFGFCTNFYDISSAILDAAQGKVPTMPSRGDMLPMPLSLVSDAEDDYDESSDASLEFISKMFRHPGLDAHNLALQTLSSLTNSSKMGRKTACNVSKAILQPESYIGDQVFALVVDQTIDPQETFGMRLMAMTIISNAVPAVSGKIASMLRERLRPVLLNDLNNASTNAQIAYLAAKTLEPLISTDHDRSELHLAFEKALSVGQARHAALAHQAEKCLKKTGR